MEASRHLPEAEEVKPLIILRKEIENGWETIYHFNVNGEESLVTMKREDDPGATDFRYDFDFFDWEFGQAEGYTQGQTAIVEWFSTTEGLNDLARIQASKLLSQSGDLLATAIIADFPEVTNIEYELAE